MVQALGQNGLQVPDGFATTVDAYRLFLKSQQPRRSHPWSAHL